MLLEHISRHCFSLQIVLLEHTVSTFTRIRIFHYYSKYDDIRNLIRVQHVNIILRLDIPNLGKF